MRADELDLGRAEVIDLEIVDAVAPPPGPVDVLAGEPPLLVTAERPVAVRPADGRAERLIASPLPRVAHAIACSGRSVTVAVRSFLHAVPGNDELVLAAGDQIQSDVRRLSGGAARDPLSWLQDELLLTTPAGAAYVASAGEGRLRDGGGFRLHGRAIDVDVVREADAHLVRRVQWRRQEPATPMLGRGECRVVDRSAAAQYTAPGVHALDQAGAAPSYLSLWTQYLDIEEESVLARLRAVGHAPYRSVHRLADRWRIVLDGPRVAGFLDRLQAEDRPLLELTDRRPEDFRQDDLDSREEQGYTSTLLRVDEADGAIEISALNGDAAPELRGHVRLSMRLESTRMQRRRRAVEKVRTGTSGIPWLGGLVENRYGARPDYRRISALSPAARRRFAGRPTPAQETALDIALNTPDIAVIQGPPGTGKTQVITALLTRLAELEDEQRRQPPPGRPRSVSGAPAPGRSTLVSSFQHDALGEVIRRGDVHGMPARKVGSRQGEAPITGAEQLRPWRDSVLTALKEDLGAESELARQAHRLQALVLQYLMAHLSGQDRPALLTQIRDVVAGRVPVALLDALDRAMLPRPVVPQSRSALAAVLERLPDDVPLQPVQAMMVVLAGEREPDVASSLLEPFRRLGNHPGRAPDDDEAVQLLEARRQLLEHLSSPAAPAEEADLGPLLERIVAAYRATDGSADGVELVLRQFVDDLEYDTDGLGAVADHYAPVVAATCQQADSFPMRDLFDRSGIHFESVIVDEAARANPTDLLIPMVLAGRRVVLVGDQRQLPHVLEPDVERELDLQAGDAARGRLRQSLFERLYDHLGALEAQTGVRRVVRLDTQYRMHPLLGRFVSESFYGGPDALRAGRPAEDFAHGLSQYGAVPAAWVDVPLAAGRESGRRSKQRSAEVQIVVDHLLEIAAERRGLTIGVITFYARQRDAIGDELRRRGYVVAPGGAVRLGGGQPDAKIGTVDAFQGNEFDVVILSLTRANALPGGTPEEVRAKWGFLTLANRLCVALSRQRSLLVVVGDTGMVTGPLAQEAVPSLHRFRGLCEEHGRVIT